MKVAYCTADDALEAGAAAIPDGCGIAVRVGPETLAVIGPVHLRDGETVLRGELRDEACEPLQTGLMRRAAVRTAPRDEEGLAHLIILLEHQAFANLTAVPDLKEGPHDD